MSLMLKAIETYDALEHLAGVPVEGMQTLTPICHILANASLEVTIDKDGNFIGAKEIDEKAVIPCTENSASRTRRPEPHPLCDQVGYVSGANHEKYELYLNELESWIDAGCNNEKVLAVREYVVKKTLLKDLEAAGVDMKKVTEDNLVIWRVEGLGDLSGSVCEDLSLQREYIEYYLSKEEGARVDYCMVTGEETRVTPKHLKGVVAFHGNAKIISSNDTKNFTYRGRFLNDAEAVSVGFVASQKAHNVLKWLVANEGVLLGDRVCICWNPSGIAVPRVIDSIEVDPDEPLSESGYRKALKEKVYGYKETLPAGEGVVVAMFDAATTGRLAVTYYSEFSGVDFMERLAAWDEVTCFPLFNEFRPPRLRSFVDYAFGTYRGDYFAADDRIFKQQMQRMVACRLENGRMPADIVRALVRNASRLCIYNDNTREKLLHTACAAIKKRYADVYGEEFDISLERDRKDRSYQYGRLLAVLEKMEKDTYGSNDSKRETNAIRNQRLFIQRPQKGFAVIMEKLQRGYIRKLSKGSRVYYDKLIQEIAENITEIGEEKGAPLTETYLLGYNLQKKALYTKRSQEEYSDGDDTETINNDEL